MQNLSSKLAPLYGLLRKGVKWVWGKPQEDIFIRVKEALQSDALSKPILLARDASPYGCGAVLSRLMPDDSE